MRDGEFAHPDLAGAAVDFDLGDGRGSHCARSAAALTPSPRPNRSGATLTGRGIAYAQRSGAVVARSSAAQLVATRAYHRAAVDPIGAVEDSDLADPPPRWCVSLLSRDLGLRQE
jgi:hypothetical protein